MRWLFVTFALVWVTGCATGPVTHGIPNLAQVDGQANIWRGGQPGPEGWRFLASQGVSNVVELNFSDDHPKEFSFHTYPISIWRQVFLPPSLYQVALAVGSVTPGTFIHCSHGQDRTGLITAEYRTWVQGWSRQEARREMLAHGFHRSLFALDYFWRHEVSTNTVLNPE